MSSDQRQHTLPALVRVDQHDGEVLRLSPINLFASGSSYSEAWLRDMLFSHPSLLPIDEIEPVFAEQIPICTELPLLTGAVDIFMLNDQALPLLVETKLWQNPEARRHVVAQGLDYARALTEGGVEALEQAIARRLGKERRVFDIVKESSDTPLDERRFYDALTTNLERGRILIILAGDGIRQGVDALTSFLRSYAKMEFAFGLVELPFYRLPQDERLLVTPRVLARTVNLELAWPTTPRGQLPSTASTRRTTISEKMFFELFAENEPDLVEPLKILVEELRARGVSVESGRASAGSLKLQWPADGKPCLTFAVLTASGNITAGHYFLFGSERKKEYYARLARFAGPGARVVGNARLSPVDAAGEPLTIRALIAHRDEWLLMVDELIAEAEETIAK